MRDYGSPWYLGEWIEDGMILVRDGYRVTVRLVDNKPFHPKIILTDHLGFTGEWGRAEIALNGWRPALVSAALAAAANTPVPASSPS